MFEITQDGSKLTLLQFGMQHVAGDYPGGLIVDSQGALFGLSEGGASGPGCGSAGCGTVFKLAKSAGGSGWTYSTVLKLNKSGKSGAYTAGQLLADHSGNLFGVTQYGGDLSCPAPNENPPGCGVAFMVTGAGFRP